MVVFVQTLTAMQFLSPFRVLPLRYVFEPKNLSSDVSETVSPSCAFKRLSAAGSGLLHIPQ